MISKEKLLNGYIENDKGELRQLFVNSAMCHGFDVDWIADIKNLDNPDNDLASLYCFILEDSVDASDHTKFIISKNKLTLEDFTETPSETTKQALIEVKNCTFTSLDIFKRMLSIAKENNLFIQFDGFTQNENDAIVVTHAASDTEYVIQAQEQFNQLIESFKVLEKFERK